MYSVVLAASMAFAPESVEVGRARAGCQGFVVQRAAPARQFVVHERAAGCAGSFATRAFRTPLRTVLGRKFAVSEAAPQAQAAPAKAVQVQSAPVAVVRRDPLLYRRCPAGAYCP